MPRCYFCKKDFEPGEEYEDHSYYEVDVFKTIGGNMHTKCRKKHEKENKRRWPWKRDLRFKVVTQEP